LPASDRAWSGGLEGRRVLVAVCGSIAAVKTPLLVTALMRAGAEVRCLLTPSAAQLVSPVALACLSRHRCYQDADQWHPSQSRPLHIALAEWADLVIVAPLSATSLARWTQGLGDGLLAAVLLACERPVLVAPAMNTAMWTHAAVRRNWEQLRLDPRVWGLDPAAGLLACDRIGEGRMAAPEMIELAAASALVLADANGNLCHDWRQRRLLVSAGPTLEALDPARLVSNRSSGRMGVLLAQAARLRGAEVTLVHGPLSLPQAWLEGLRCHPVESAAQMERCLQEHWPQTDALAMAAAVADWRRRGGPAPIKASKDRGLSALAVELEAVPDLLAALVQQRRQGQVCLGFAALSGDDVALQEQAESKLHAKGCDWLFANPIDRPGQGFGDAANGGWLLGRDGTCQPVPVTDKLVLAHQLLDRLAVSLDQAARPAGS
jgi:phosphopantothenoylcysteine decarboxylase/phosphopantothenate--cysteine ligase